MNRIAKIMAGGLIAIGLTGSAYAANFTKVDLSVTVTSPINISIVSGGVITFPSVALANATGVIGGSSTTIKNDSIGLNVALLLAGNDDSNWQCGGATTTVTVAAANQFALRAIFNGNTVPVAGDFLAANDYIASQTFPRNSSTQLTFPNGFRRPTAVIFAGLETGENIAPGASRGLWTQFIPATSTTVDFGVRTLVLSIVAQL